MRGFYMSHLNKSVLSLLAVNPACQGAGFLISTDLFTPELLENSVTAFLYNLHIFHVSLVLSEEMFLPDLWT